MKKNILYLVLLPFLFYTAAFCLITYPLITKFNTHIFADSGDGLQHVWNLWWTNKSITEFHELPLSTNYLHYPFGITLIGHTLNPINGVIAIILLKFFTLAQSYNLILIFTFAAGGAGTFLLSYYVSKSYIGSIFAGYFYTFSNYHFAHVSHLELVSIQIIPLFLLFLILFYKEKTTFYGLLASTFLIMQFFLGMYYFLYLLISLFIFFLLEGLKNRSYLINFIKQKKLPLFVFLIIITAYTLPFGYLFIKQDREDKFIGSHPSVMYSANLISFITPGSSSFFYTFLEKKWPILSKNTGENNTYLGIVPVLLFFYFLKNKRKLKETLANYWIFTFVIFLILSLGPILQICRIIVSWILMPYGLLEIVFPPITATGVPARMSIMAILSLSVLSALGMKQILEKKHMFPLLIIFILTIIEFFPSKSITTSIDPPAYVNFLKENQTKSAVIDLAASPYEGMYYQTIHNKPIAFGFISRVPKSNIERNVNLLDSIKRGEYHKLCEKYHFKYLTVKKTKTIPNSNNLKQVFGDKDTLIYDLSPSRDCIM